SPALGKNSLFAANFQVPFYHSANRPVSPLERRPHVRIKLREFAGHRGDSRRSSVSVGWSRTAEHHPSIAGRSVKPRRGADRGKGTDLGCSPGTGRPQARERDTPLSRHASLSESGCALVKRNIHPRNPISV